MTHRLPIAQLPRSGENWMEPWHRRLAHRNHLRLNPRVPESDWQHELAEQIHTQEMEACLLQADRVAIKRLMKGIPSGADDFLTWFEGLREHGPGQGDSLFPWLAATADLESMRWFLTQEAAGEAGFDDLVALAQVRIPARAKLEMARNYWDEMGRGHLDGMHAGLLDAVVTELDLQPSIDETVWESLALANIMVALATNRAFAYHAIGALGVIEMTAPGRVSLVNEGLRRMGTSASVRRYYQLHAGLDVKHSEAWNREVIHPIVEQSPEAAIPIAEGALLRLYCGARTFRRYRQALGLGDAKRTPRAPRVSSQPTSAPHQVQVHRAPLRRDLALSRH